MNFKGHGLLCVFRHTFKCRGLPLVCRVNCKGFNGDSIVCTCKGQPYRHIFCVYVVNPKCRGFLIMYIVNLNDGGNILCREGTLKVEAQP